MGAPGPPAGPRTKLDVLYHEVLGDVADLVGRLEVLQGKVQDLERTRAGERAAEALERSTALASSRVRADFDHAAEQLRRHLAAMASGTSAAAAAAGRARRWRIYAACAGLSLVSSFVAGGLLVGAHLLGLW